MTMFINHTSSNLKTIPVKSFQTLKEGHCYLRENNFGDLVFVDHIQKVTGNITHHYTDGLHIYDWYGEPVLSGNTIRYEINVEGLRDSIWERNGEQYKLLDICDVRSLFGNQTPPTWMVVLEGTHPIPFLDLLRDYLLK